MLAEKAAMADTERLLDILNRPNKYEIPRQGIEWQTKAEHSRKKTNKNI